MSRPGIRDCRDVRLRLCGRRRTRQRTGKAGDCGHGARDAGDEPPGAASMQGRAPAALRTQAHPAAHPARQATATTGPETLAMSSPGLRDCRDVLMMTLQIICVWSVVTHTDAQGQKCV